MSVDFVHFNIYRLYPLRFLRWQEPAIQNPDVRNADHFGMPGEWNNVNHLPDEHVRIDPHAFYQMQSLYNQTYVMMKNSINDYTLDFDWFLRKLTKK